MKTSSQLAIVTLLLVGAHALGTGLHWYEKFFGYDTLVHFIGGAWVALVLNQFLKLKGLRLVGAVLAVALLWEAFEFSVAAYIQRSYSVDSGIQPNIADTVSDIVTGVFAATLTARFLVKEK